MGSGSLLARAHGSFPRRGDGRRQASAAADDSGRPPRGANALVPGGGLAALSATLRPVRVVIADDHRLMLDGIHKALEADGGFEIVGETLDGTEVVSIVERTQPDLVLLDVRMPKMDGLDVPRRGREALPRDQGRDAVGLDLTGADRRRAAPRSERLPREERRPERSPLDAPPGARGQRLGDRTASPTRTTSRAARRSASPSARRPSCRRSRGGCRTTRSRRSCG